MDKDTIYEDSRVIAFELRQLGVPVTIGKTQLNSYRVYIDISEDNFFMFEFDDATKARNFLHVLKLVRQL